MSTSTDNMVSMTDKLGGSKSKLHSVWGLDPLVWKKFRRAVFLKETTCGDVLNGLIAQWLSDNDSDVVTEGRLNGG